MNDERSKLDYLRIQESRIMQLLPLSNPIEKDIPELSRLMFEAYESKYNKYADPAVAERNLRALMSRRTFLEVAPS